MILCRSIDILTGLLCRFAASLSRHSAGNGSFRLEYNATLSAHSKILDTLDEIDRVQCFADKIVLHLAHGVDASSYAEQFRKQSVIHGGKEWECTDKYGRARPFYFHVNITEVEAKQGVVTLGGSHCSPFALFERLKWSLAITSPSEDVRRSMPTDLVDGQVSTAATISKSWKDTFNPAPVSISADFVKLAKTILGKKYKATLGLNASAAAAASFGMSPVTLYWDIDVETKYVVDVKIVSTTLWVQFTPSLSVDLAIRLNSGKLGASFTILPNVPIPDLAAGFTVGFVSFELGAFLGATGSVNLAVTAPMSLSAGVAVSQPIKCGFTYNGTFTTIRSQGPRSVVPHTSSQEPNLVDAALTFSLIPTLNFGLEGSFLRKQESLELEVSCPRPAGSCTARAGLCACIQPADAPVGIWKEKHLGLKGSPKNRFARPLLALERGASWFEREGICVCVCGWVGGWLGGWVWVCVCVCACVCVSRVPA